MTYRELLDQLRQATDPQLDANVVVCDSNFEKSDVSTLGVLDAQDDDHPDNQLYLFY